MQTDLDSWTYIWVWHCIGAYHERPVWGAVWAVWELWTAAATAAAAVWAAQDPGGGGGDLSATAALWTGSYSSLPFYIFFMNQITCQC